MYLKLFVWKSRKKPEKLPLVFIPIMAPVVFQLVQLISSIMNTGLVVVPVPPVKAFPDIPNAALDTVAVYPIFVEPI